VAKLIAETEDKLLARIAAFDDADTPYPPRVMPFRATIAGDYDHLARVREWSLTGWEEEE
jgi:ATP-dependent helicase/nuclease subunit B